MEIAVLALGCFWGPEIKFGKLEGIKKTEVGYCGGNSNRTTYEKVCSGNTNHAEVVKLEFDPKKISYEKIFIPSHIHAGIYTSAFCIGLFSIRGSESFID